MEAVKTRRWGADGQEVMREEFLRTAADRLKTPITALGLALQRMEDVQTEEERRAFLEMAKRGQKELTQAVSEVLDAARGDEKEEM